MNYSLDLSQLGRNHSQLGNLVDRQQESVLTIRKTKRHRSPRKTQNTSVSPRIEINELDKLGQDIAKKVGNIMKVQNFQGKTIIAEHL